MRYPIILALIGASAAFPALAQAPVAAPAPTGVAPVSASPLAPSPMLIKRANDVVLVMNGEGDLADIFTPEFLAQVPPAAIRQLSGQISGQIGKALRVSELKPADAYTASAVIAFERGSARISLAIAPGPEARIGGLLVRGIDLVTNTAITSLELLASEFRKLPGATGFSAMSLDSPATRQPAASGEVAANIPLAIGSTFKLVILAELVRQIDAGQRKWDDSVTLGACELPGGGYNSGPAGTRVPLRELAEAMIKVSDNSATDVLLFTLGRERVEAMAARLGWRAMRNRPFLGTMEAFKLKGVGGGSLGARYVAANLAEQRRLLAGEVAATPGSAIGNLFADGKPVRIDTLEWFASPRELTATMRWFRDHAATPAGAEALRILAVNPGPLGGMTDTFGYVGYKGGSEPGVINMTLLIRDKAGHWSALSAGWNNPAAPVDELAFTALVRRAAQLVAQGTPAR